MGGGGDYDGEWTRKKIGSFESGGGEQAMEDGWHCLVRLGKH